jgi:hypothetical protein
MALIGEAIVEEWLNRDGYFTIRGIKLGVHEIDLLAIKLENGRAKELRHIECQISYNAVSWITPATAEMQKTGLKPQSTKPRSLEMIVQCVNAWINKKYASDKKNNLRQMLCPGEWSREVVLGDIKFQEEVDELIKQGIKVIEFKNVLKSLIVRNEMIPRAAGGDIFELMKWLTNIKLYDSKKEP